MINLLIAAALGLAFPSASSPPADSVDAKLGPAMFVVGDADTTIFLFGTFHALDGRSQWFSEGIRRAFENSDELVLETLVPEYRGTPQPALGAAAAVQIAPSASFLATTRMAIDAGKQEGMQVGNGADMVLRHVAEREGKSVQGLETLDSQLAMFGRMPGQLAVARSTTAPAPNPAATLAQSMMAMQSAWTRGDQSLLVQMLDQLDRASPAMYRMLFTERNGRWADWVSARLKTPGVVFVAVGAGHLVGKDSVLVRLAQRGIDSRRVN
ncbi:MAG: TraB/GumN family protein [Sphingomicrobium sp.]